MRRCLLAFLPLALLAAMPAPGARANDGPANPFGPVASALRLGRTLRIRGAALVTVQLPTQAQAQVDAQVGLAGTLAEILPLPGPAGVWHVRITNPDDRPLLIPTGTALLTPLEASRVTDRAVCIAPNAATFVPVVQAATPVPQGPYVSRGRGLTPFEQSMIPPDRWLERVRARNGRMGVVGTRRDDVAHAYTTPSFAELLKQGGAELDALVASPTTVGIFVADDRGPCFAHIQTNRKRFLEHWPFLRDGILVDASLVASVGGSSRPGDEGKLRLILRSLLSVLATKPLCRPNFGEGWEYRWPLTDPPGHWDGLAVPDGPLSLRLYRYPTRPAGSVTPPGSGTETPEVPDPGTFELERRVRPTEYEQRLEKRRERLRNPTPGPSNPQPSPRPAPRPGAAPVPQLPRPS